jgi:hypothetical protein
MGRVAYNLNGVDRIRKYLIGASFPRVGVIACGDPDTPDPLILPTTTTCVDSIGMNKDTAVYSATPAAGATGIITVSYHPDNVYSFRASGSAVDGVALGVFTETAGDVSTPDTVTATLPTANSMVGGTVWRYHGEGQPCSLAESRMILTHTSTTSLAVTVDWEYPINIGDQFLFVPWTIYPGDGTDTSDGNTNVQFTTNLTEADGSIATGSGAIVAVVDILMRGSTDTEVQFTLPDHPYRIVVA